MNSKVTRWASLTLIIIATLAAGAGIVAGQLYSSSKFRTARIISDTGLEAQAANTQTWGALSLVDTEHFNVPSTPGGLQQYLDLLNPLLGNLAENQAKLPPVGKAALSGYLESTQQVVSLIEQGRPAEAYAIQNSLSPSLTEAVTTLDLLGDDYQSQADRVSMLSVVISITFYAAIILLLTVFFRRRNKTQRDLARAIAEREISATSEARFRSLIQNSSSIISVVDADGVLVYQSVTVKKLGFAPTDLLRSKFLTLVHPSDQSLVSSVIGQAMSEIDGSGTVECRLRMRNGDWMQVELVVQNLLHDPYVRGLVLTALDIRERKMYEEQLSHQATHDALTGLPNRLLFRDRLHHALETVAADGAIHAVLFLDLDDFKTINDSLGHLAGDKFLAIAAERLRSRVRSHDTVARFGGDEFAILLEDTTESDALDVAERIITAFESPVDLEGRSVKGGISIGIVFAGHDGETAEDILRDADTAMYMAKARGKGRREVFSVAMREAVLARLDLEADMREGLKGGQFAVQYQPILDFASRKVVGFEALARWHHPTRGLIMPNDFIPIAEETGLVLELGAQVLSTACKQVRAWQIAYPSVPLLFLAVNVSARQLMHSSLSDELSKALEISGLPPNTLTLEITETVLAQNSEAVIERLKAIRALGVGIAIDDFGTGYSSLSYLHQFPVDVVKIDKSFVEAITGEAGGTELPDAIVSLAHALNLKTVAEGVERSEQIQHLTDIGCDLWQGFYFAEAMQEDKIEEMLADPESAIFDPMEASHKLAS